MKGFRMPHIRISGQPRLRALRPAGLPRLSIAHHFAAGGQSPVGGRIEFNPATHSLWYVHDDPGGGVVFDSPVENAASTTPLSGSEQHRQPQSAPAMRAKSAVSAPRPLDKGSKDTVAVNDPKAATPTLRPPPELARVEAHGPWHFMVASPSENAALERQRQEVESYNDRAQTQYEAEQQRAENAKPGLLGTLIDVVKNAQAAGQAFTPPTPAQAPVVAPPSSSQPGSLDGLGVNAPATSSPPTPDTDPDAPRLAHGGSAKPKIVHETEHEIRLQLPVGPILRVAKAALHPDHIAAIRMMCGGSVPHLAEGTPDAPVSEDPGQSVAPAQPNASSGDDNFTPADVQTELPADMSHEPGTEEEQKQALYARYRHALPSGPATPDELWSQYQGHLADDAGEREAAKNSIFPYVPGSRFSEWETPPSAPVSEVTVPNAATTQPSGSPAPVAVSPADAAGSPSEQDHAHQTPSGGGRGVGRVGKPPDLTEFDAGAQQVLGANKALGDLAVKQADEEATVKTATAAQLDNLQKDYTTRLDTAQQKADAAFQDYMNAKIDPDRVFGGSAAAQITAAISMALGAFGATLGRTPNFAAQIIDKAIDRDIDAQKATIGKKASVVQHYLQEGNTLRQSELLAKADLQDAAAAKIASIAARYAGTDKAAQLEQASGLYRQKSSMDRSQAIKSAVDAQYAPALMQSSLATQALQRKLLSAQAVLAGAKASGATGRGGASPLDLDNGPDLYRFIAQGKGADNLPEHLVKTVEQVPLVGKSGQPVTDNSGQPIEQVIKSRWIADSASQATKAKEQLAATEEQNRKLADIQKYIGQHPYGAWNYTDWKDANRLIGDFKLSWLKSDENLNRFNEQEQNIVSAMVSNPANPFAAFVGNPQAAVDSFRNMIRTRRQVIKDTYLKRLPDGFRG